MQKKKQGRAGLRSIEQILEALRRQFDSNGALSVKIEELLLRLYKNKDILDLIKEDADFSKLDFWVCKERDRLKGLAKAIFSSTDELDLIELSKFVPKEKLFDLTFATPPEIGEVIEMYLFIHEKDSLVNRLLGLKQEETVVYIPPVFYDSSEKLKWQAVPLREAPRIQPSETAEEIRDFRFQIPLHKRNLTLLLGRTGVGKTTFTVNLSINWAEAGYRVLYISREIASSVIYRYADSILRHLSIDESVLDNFYISEAESMGVIARLVKEIKPDILVLDFLSLIAPMQKPKENSEWQTIIQTAKESLALAKQENTAVFAIAQTTKEHMSSTAITEASILGGSAVPYIASNIYVLDFKEVYNALKTKKSAKANISTLLERIKKENIRHMVLYSVKTRYTSPFEKEFRFYPKLHLFEIAEEGKVEGSSQGRLDDYPVEINTLTSSQPLNNLFDEAAEQQNQKADEKIFEEGSGGNGEETDEKDEEPDLTSFFDDDDAVDFPDDL